ncbi:MAG: alpha-glucan family phosphorylase [Gammaproteobacteria bacterium]|jgi:starch phosphorylase
MQPSHYLTRTLPSALEPLATLALDLRWSWNHAMDELWRTVDPDLWEATANPLVILETISNRRLEELAADATFIEALETQVNAREAHLQEQTWFSQHPDVASLGGVAYFSMEFGLSEALPIYSGGLGILAGDHLKTSCDLGVPVTGIGLLYQQGYFRQALDNRGDQIEFFPYNDPTALPISPVMAEDGGWLRVSIDLPGRKLSLRVWQVQVGRVALYLLDSNDPLNSPGDRGITSELYGGGHEMRLRQEIALGIGGWRLLEMLHIPCEVCHLNEGHAAFAVLERARHFMHAHDISFQQALLATRGGNLFTTHTPVAAGFDQFSPRLMNEYFSTYAAQLGISLRELLALGRPETTAADTSFNMAHLALRGSTAVNGVSQLHGQVSRRIFQPLFPRWPQHEVPVGHITNGIHVPSWDSAAADALWTDACGKARWLGDLSTLEQDFRQLSDESLWRFRSNGRQRLVNIVRSHARAQYSARGVEQSRIEACARLLDPNTLTLGFARRFAEYKRPNLLLHDPDRLIRLLTHPDHPVQLVIAGKAHPQDMEGKRLVRAWADFQERPEVRGRVIFLEDYDMHLAAHLVQGVDLWVNTPRRPWEASGTSGMKVLVNGGLNCSELDGWWAEAYTPDAGWAVGDGREHDADPAWDAHEAQTLYQLLETEIVPEYYERDVHGIPTKWVARMRESLALLTPQYSTNRMLREYAETYYLPLAKRFRARSENNAALSADLMTWRARLSRHWASLHTGELDFEPHADGGGCAVSVPVYLDDLEPDDVRVELYADATGEGNPPLRIELERKEALTGAVHGYRYLAELKTDRPLTDFTLRVIPYHPQALVPLEAHPILWVTHG